MGDFESCRFDFRIDIKKGLTPSKRKKAERRNYSYNTLFKCKVCGNLFDNRPLLLAHKLIHNVYRCTICQVTFPKQSMLKEHIAGSHDGTNGHCQVVYTCNKLSPLWPKADSDVSAAVPDAPPPYDVSPPVSAVPTPTSTPSQFVCINMPVFISPNDWEHDRCPDMLTDVMTHTDVVTHSSAVTSVMTPHDADAHPSGDRTPSPMATIKCEPEELLTTELSEYQYNGDDDLEPGEIRRGGCPETFPIFSTNNSSILPTCVNMSMKGTHCDTLSSNVQPTDPGQCDELSQQGNDLFRMQEEYAKVPTVKQEPQIDITPAMCSDNSQDLQWTTRVSNDHIVDISELPTPVEDDNIDCVSRPDLCNGESVTNGRCTSPPRVADSPLDHDHSELNTNSQKHGLRMDVFRCELCSFQGQCAHELAHHLCRHRKPPRTDLNQMVERLWKTKMQNPHSQNTANKKTDPVSMSTDEVETTTNMNGECKHRHEISAEPMVCATGAEDVAILVALPAVKKKRRPKQDYCTIKFHTCKFCRQLFDSAEKMWEHVMTHNECRKRSKSTLSNYRYTMLQRLKAVAVTTAEHASPSSEDVTSIQDGGIGEGTNGTETSRFACVYRGCVARYASHTDLMQHVRCHQLLQPQQLHDDGSTKEHASTSNEVQIVNCDYPGCTKTFRDWRHLKRHRTIHTGEKPLACGLCSYSCRHRSSMNWHMKSKHGLAKTKTNGNRTVYVDNDGNVIDGSAIDHVTKKAVTPKVKNCMTNLDSNDNVKEVCSQINIEDEGPIDLSMKTLCSSEPSEFLATLPRPLEGADAEGSDSVLSDHQVVSSIDTRHTTPDRQLETMHESAGPEFYTSVMKFRYTNPKSQNVALEDSSHGNGNHGDGANQTAYESKYYTCKLCRQLFESAEQMWEHRVCAHDEHNQFFCDHCGLEAHSKYDLQSHMMATHGKEVGEFKEYLCFVCGKGYSSRTGLNNHLLVHSEDGPPKFVCPHPGCLAKLHSKGALKNHVRRLHLKIQPRWQCPHDGCCRRFDTTSALRAHQVVHSDDRPLTCNFPGCDKSFRESKHLRVHRMQHTDERPLKCHLCEYSCRQRNSMNWHMKSKHQLYKQVTADGRTVYGPAQTAALLSN